MYPYDATPQMQDQLQKLLMSPLQPQQAAIHVTKVKGKPGAESFNMPPNSDTVLLDMDDPIAWFVMTDGAGYKTITPYDLSLHVEKTQKDEIKSLEERIVKLEEAMRNGKSNFRTNEQKSKSGDFHNDAGNRGNAQG